MPDIDEKSESEALKLIRDQISIKRNELRSLRESARYGHIPFTELEKAELKLRLTNLELLREKAEASAFLAFQAEQDYKEFFVELAGRHGVHLSEDFRLPSRLGSGVKLVSAPSSAHISEPGEEALCMVCHSVCHSVCCWQSEDGGCEQEEEYGCTFAHPGGGSNDSGSGTVPLPPPGSGTTPLPPGSGTTPLPGKGARKRGSKPK